MAPRIVLQLSTTKCDLQRSGLFSFRQSVSVSKGKQQIETMADYFSELGFRPLGEGETPDHSAHLLRLLRDSGNIDLLQMMLEMRAGGGSAAPAASKEAVQSLPSLDPPVSEQCTVCLKHYDENDTCRMMPCKHVFHQECIFTWLKQTNSCPMCRKEMPTDDPDYEAIRKHKEREGERKLQLEELHNSMFS